ncbi:ADP-ribosylglycohydrolase family protein, partial [Patescibacteria group bacterium]
MQHQQIESMLLGVAIGDAFGAGVEFMDREWIRENVDFTKFVNARGMIKKDKLANEPHYQPWDYTDDTEMTIGVVDAITSALQLTPDLLMQSWLSEHREDVKRRGYERAGHGSMKRVYDGRATILEVRDFQKNREYPGNAPPMRAVPMGLVDTRLINAYAIANADATHPHPKARASSVLVARAAEYMMCKPWFRSGLIHYCSSCIRGIDMETVELLEKVDELPPPDELQSEHYEVLCGPQPIQLPRFLPGINGLPSDAMLTACCALYVIKHSDSAMEGLRHSIYMGGDTDSLASICVGILAGRYGIHSLPRFMIENVEGRPRMFDLAVHLCHSLEEQEEFIQAGDEGELETVAFLKL